LPFAEQIVRNAAASFPREIATMTSPTPPAVRTRRQGSSNSFLGVLYYSLTGSGGADWMRFERNVRMMHMFTETLMFLCILIGKEWLRSRVQRN
jgi:hypothetical protein